MGACAAMAAAGGDAATSPAIEVQVRDCKTGVSLVARQAPLSKVMEQLAQTLRFKLEGQEDARALVDLTITSPGPEIVNRLLTPHGRFMMTTAKDPRCPGRLRVARVWLLPEGSPQAAARRGAPPAKPASAVVAATETATAQRLRAAEAEARRRKEAYQAYVAQHGKPPPEEEQEEARP
jgi:hypothetical protein